MTHTTAHPALPLKNIVVYPHIVQHLAVGRRASMAALKRSTERVVDLVTVAQRAANVENPSIDDLGLLEANAGQSVTVGQRGDRSTQGLELHEIFVDHSIHDLCAGSLKLRELLRGGVVGARKRHVFFAAPVVERRSLDS